MYVYIYIYTYISNRVVQWTVTKTKDLKEATRRAPRVYRKPRPFYTNSIAGSRLPSVVEKHIIHIETVIW